MLLDTLLFVCIGSPTVAHVALPIESRPPSEVTLVHADGRREAARDPLRATDGTWVAELDGRRVILRPGEIVAIVDAEGDETVLIPDEPTTEVPQRARDALAVLRDDDAADWLRALDDLAKSPCADLREALVELGGDRSKESRRRAVHGLCALRTREGTLAAAGLVLDEANKSLRKEIADALFSVREIFARTECEELLARGLSDRDGGVRFVFAAISPRTCDEAVPVLEKDGLRSRDHHTRETAALELGRRGSAAGEALLVRMLERDRIPGLHDEDEDFVRRLVVAEKVAVCDALGTIATERAVEALRRATSSEYEEVRDAAETALQRIASKSGD
ncbi:MAG: hypothetical protein R3F34_09890 [Planctomycetota bacterium]